MENSISKTQSKCVFFSGLAALLVVIGIGTFHAYSRGGNDFSVFYQAWSLVLSGQGQDIYRLSPDRFLYSPGFAWLFSPLAILPKIPALALWCLLKTLLLFFAIKRLGDRQFINLLSTSSTSVIYDKYLTPGISIWGTILISRPLLIDFEYGQVNFFILASCIWALLGHFEKKTTFLDIGRWLVLTSMAVSKLLTLPLLLIPWIVTAQATPKKLKYERLGIILGLAISVALPLLSQGIEGTWYLFIEWSKALVSRGLPLESHNQSFIALLYHYLSGQPTHFISEGSNPLLLGGLYLSSEQIVFSSLFWTFSSLGIILGWLLCAFNHPPIKWIAVLIGLLILPSHLVWKPYFVMSLPLAIVLLHQTTKRKQIAPWLILFTFFIGLNLTGFDFVGHTIAAHFEAASLFLIIHILMIVAVFL